MRTLICGCPRSGTSILGELFAHDPRCDYLYEPIVEQLRPDELNVDTVCKLPRSNRPQDQWTPGLPFQRADLDRFEPWQAIWLVRNPFDTVCSLRPGVTANAHRPMPGGTTGEWYEKAARMWVWVNDSGYHNLKDRIVETIRYEEMVGDPRHTGRVLLETVGRNPDEGPSVPLLDLWVGTVSNETGLYEAQQQTHWTTDDHDRHIGRHHDNLTDVQRERVYDTVGSTAERFYPKLIEGSACMSPRSC